MDNNNYLAIKLGGSLLSTPEKLFDFDYLRELRKIIEPVLENGVKMLMVVGGGTTMRNYRDLAKENGITETIQLHWIGTTVNVLHGEISRAYFHDLADDGVMKYEEYYNGLPLNIEKKLKFGGGGRPGHSGDVDAILGAQKIGAKRIISLKNIDGVYEADPKQKPEAKRMTNITWDEYLEIIGHKTEHEPGGNYPIDPIASRMAKEAGLEFVVVLGSDLNNFEKVLKGEDFIGTIVKD